MTKRDKDDGLFPDGACRYCGHIRHWHSVSHLTYKAKPHAKRETTIGVMMSKCWECAASHGQEQVVCYMMGADIVNAAAAAHRRIKELEAASAA